MKKLLSPLTVVLALSTSGTASEAALPASSIDAQQPAERLAGRYAVRKKSATIRQVPLLGDTPTVETSYGLATIEVSDGSAEMVERYCRSICKSSVETQIPDRVARALGELRQTLTVWREGDRVRWSRPEIVKVLGANLENPRTDALPTSPKDPRVTDQDMDGHPGFTVFVRGFLSGQLYLVERLVDRYDGELGADNTLTGLLANASTSQIIDASSVFLRVGAPARPDPDASKSTVLFVPISTEMSCDALISAIPQLFPEE